MSIYERRTLSDDPSCLTVTENNNNKDTESSLENDVMDFTNENLNPNELSIYENLQEVVPDKSDMMKKTSHTNLLIHNERNPSINDETRALDQKQCSLPWTPKSLSRAKTAIIYKKTLNDTLFIYERSHLFFSTWEEYFISLQNDYLFFFKERCHWERGDPPCKIIQLKSNMFLNEMKLEVNHEPSYGTIEAAYRIMLEEENENSNTLQEKRKEQQSETEANEDIEKDKTDEKDDRYDTEVDNITTRLFYRKLLEMDQMDDWLNIELKQNLTQNTKQGYFHPVVTNNPLLSATTILQFGSYDSNTFELWSKAIRRNIQQKKISERKNSQSHMKSIQPNSRSKLEEDVSPKFKTVQSWGKLLFGSSSKRSSHDNQNNNQTENCPENYPFCKVREGKKVSHTYWTCPANDSKISLHHSELWCRRMVVDDYKKADSEFRRLIAMENLINQITCPSIALVVYEKVSRVHEMFVANALREMNETKEEEEDEVKKVKEKMSANGLSTQEKDMTNSKEKSKPKEKTKRKKISPEVLYFFVDHLKRKYSIFLNVALAYNIPPDAIREAHEEMCRENSARYAGVGGGGKEAGAVYQKELMKKGFNSEEFCDLYEKYRSAAISYYEYNYGDTQAAEEEDAVMHLPVLIHIAQLRKNEEEAKNLTEILEHVKAWLTKAVGNMQSDTILHN